MEAKVGDRVVVDSETVGQPPREGEVVEVIEGSGASRLRVRWTDGHESLFTPSSGGTRIEEATEG